MRKLFITIIVFIGICINVNAQEKSHKELKGDKYAFRYSYDKSIESYTRAKQLSVEGQRKLADIYYKMGQNIQSEETYSKLINISSAKYG